MHPTVCRVYQLGACNKATGKLKSDTLFRGHGPSHQLLSSHCDSTSILFACIQHCMGFLHTSPPNICMSRLNVYLQPFRAVSLFAQQREIDDPVMHVIFKSTTCFRADSRLGILSSSPEFIQVIGHCSYQRLVHILEYC